MIYKPFEERTPDTQYHDLLARIVEAGEVVDSQQEEEAFRVIGHQMRFDLRNGFPIITERDLVSQSAKGAASQFEQAVAEHVAFLNGAHTQEQLSQYGCTWWNRWATPEKCKKRGLEPGDLGPGSYGPAWRNFPTQEGQPFDQITHLIEQVQELPHLRTHFVSPWIPQYTGRGKNKVQKVVVVPCHGWLHIFANPRTGTMDLHHFQRSADAPVGLVFNLIQYAAFLMVLAQITGYMPRELVYTTSDTHIFRNQLADVRDLLDTKPGRFPTVQLDPSVKNIFELRPEHFTISDYFPQLPRRRIWTPV